MLKSLLVFSVFFLFLPFSYCITQFTTIYRVNDERSRLHVKVEVYGRDVYRFFFSILDQSKSITTYVDGAECRQSCSQVVAIGGVVTLSYSQGAQDFVIFNQTPTGTSFYFKGCLQDLCSCRISPLPTGDFSVCEDSTNFDTAKPMFDCHATVPSNTTTSAMNTTNSVATTPLLTSSTTTPIATTQLITTEAVTTSVQVTTQGIEPTTSAPVSTSSSIFTSTLQSTPSFTTSPASASQNYQSTTQFETTSAADQTTSWDLPPITHGHEPALEITTIGSATTSEETDIEGTTPSFEETTTFAWNDSTSSIFTETTTGTDDSSTEKTYTTIRIKTTETPIQILKNLSDSGVSLDNVTDVLDTTLSITDDPQALGGDEIYYVANILTESANLTGLPEIDAISILQNMDNVLSAGQLPIQHSESQQRLLDVLPLMVSNCNASSIQFLGGMNMGFASNLVGAPAKFNGLVDKVQIFEIVNGDVREGELNAISVPQNFVTGECDGCEGVKNVFFTIFRNRKLFNTETKYRPYQSFAMADKGQNDGLYPDPCDRQTQIPEDVPVMTATVTDGGGVSISRLAVQKVMARTQFNVTSLLRPLHGQYQVTWWDVDNQNWATTDLCQSELKNGMLYSTCDHLTDFTLIVDGMVNDPNVCVQALTDVSIATNTVSLVSLLFLILIQISAYIPALAATRICGKLLGTSASYPDTIQLFFNLVLFLFYLVFMIFSDQDISGHACNFMAALAYSLLLCSILLTIFQAQRTVIGFFPHVIRKFNQIVLRPLSAFTICFICPFVLSVLLSFLTPFFRRNDGFCWVRPDLVIYATIIPVSVLILNAILCTSLVVWRMCQARRKVTKHGRHHDGQLKTKILSIIVLQITMGMPWIVQYFTLYYPEATAWHYIFSIVIGSQGTMLALIYFYKRHKLYRRNTATNRRKYGMFDNSTSPIEDMTNAVISMA